MKGQMYVLAVLILAIAAGIAVAFYAGFGQPLSIKNPSQAGVNCRLNNFDMICDYDFQSTESCPNVPIAEVEIVRCPDFPQAINQGLCDLYQGKWIENGQCCQGPYNNARIILNSPNSEPPNTDFTPTVLWRNGMSVQIPFFNPCGANPLEKPNVFPRLSGKVTITPISLPPACGDGNLDAGEECDDGNTQSGDGCSALCMTEEEPPVPPTPPPVPPEGVGINISIIIAVIVIISLAAGLFMLLKYGG